MTKKFVQQSKPNLPKKNYLMDNVRKNILTYDLKKYALKSTIDVTKEESEIFSLLNKVVEKYKLGTVCRVAGGWVRDKVFKATDT
jgi:hypothetical protein